MSPCSVPENPSQLVTCDHEPVSVTWRQWLGSCASFYRCRCFRPAPLPGWFSVCLTWSLRVFSLPELEPGGDTKVAWPWDRVRMVMCGKWARAASHFVLWTSRGERVTRSGWGVENFGSVGWPGKANESDNESCLHSWILMVILQML